MLSRDGVNFPGGRSRGRGESRIIFLDLAKGMRERGSLVETPKGYRRKERLDLEKITD